MEDEERKRERGRDFIVWIEGVGRRFPPSTSLLTACLCNTCSVFRHKNGKTYPFIGVPQCNCALLKKKGLISRD